MRDLRVTVGCGLHVCAEYVRGPRCEWFSSVRNNGSADCWCELFDVPITLDGTGLQGDGMRAKVCIEAEIDRGK